MMTDIQDDADIKELVHAFYDRVAQDERLGYIFNDVAAVDWEQHLPQMVDFWSNILFRTGRYQGRPYRQHRPLPLQMDDFRRWFTLFCETVDTHFQGERATCAKEMAGRIASSFTARLQSEGRLNHK